MSLRTATITPGMMRAFRRRKRDCPHCGLIVPIYRGRYPLRCPNCRRPWDEPIPEAIVEDEIDNMMQVAGTEAPPAAFEPEPGSEMGQIFDNALQRVNKLELLDYFVGFDMDPDSRSLTLYFSEFIKEEALDQLMQEMRNIAPDVNLQQVEEGDAAWSVTLIQAQAAEEPDVEGEIGQEVELGGELEVSK
jgi:hypothetical protein